MFLFLPFYNEFTMKFATILSPVIGVTFQAMVALCLECGIEVVQYGVRLTDWKFTAPGETVTLEDWIYGSVIVKTDKNTCALELIENKLKPGFSVRLRLYRK